MAGISRTSTLSDVKDNLLRGRQFNDRVADAKVIASGVVTGIDGGKVYKIETETHASNNNADTLTTITWDTSVSEKFKDGAIIKLHPNNSLRTIKIARYVAGDTNINVPQDIDLLSVDDFVYLMYNAGTAKWDLVCYQGSPSGSQTVTLATGAAVIGAADTVLLKSEDTSPDTVTDITCVDGPLYIGRPIVIKRAVENIVIAKTGNINHGETATITLDADAEYAFAIWDGTKWQVQNHTGTAG